MTAKKAAEITELRELRPELSWDQIGEIANVSGARVSEVVAGKRGEESHVKEVQLALPEVR